MRRSPLSHRASVFSLLCAFLAIRSLLAPHAAPQQPRPSFDVVSVHPTPEDYPAQNALFTYPGGRVVCKGCWLQYLVMEAFHLQPNQIEGGPSWFSNARFDIEAKPAADTDLAHSSPKDPKMPPADEQRLMLQSMLADRFHLRTHQASKPGQIYELVTNGKPLQLHPPKTMDVMPWAGNILGVGQGLEGENISMPQLAFRMTDWLNRPVIDKTGIKGSFDFRAKMDDNDPAPDDDPWATLKPALHSLGLDLKPAQGAITTLVVESAMKPQPN